MLDRQRWSAASGTNGDDHKSYHSPPILLYTRAGGVYSEEEERILANDSGAWQNVPKLVWEYSVGGFQVLPKWLSYRHVRQTEQPLSASDIDTVTQLCRRVYALVALEDECDRIYDLAAAGALEPDEAGAPGAAVQASSP